MPATKPGETLWICSMGKQFLVRGVFDTVDETNTYLKQHPDTGVIASIANHHFVANLYEVK